MKVIDSRQINLGITCLHLVKQIFKKKKNGARELLYIEISQMCQGLV